MELMRKITTLIPPKTVSLAIKNLLRSLLQILRVTETKTCNSKFRAKQDFK